MKKFLSLVLALVMTMSLVTVSAGAKDFTDDETITYGEAVNVMSEVGVIDGYTDGSFQPTTNLTRGAAAKIICNLILGPTTAAALGADTAPYSDVPTTNVFAGYIAYCQKTGIISGYADGTFKPSAPLTGYAFMKMLLGALGYNSNVEGYTGSNWSINVAKQAIAIGLNKGNDDFSGQAYVNREEAMLYAFNTMQATMVEYPQTTTVVGGDGSEVVLASARKEVSWGSALNSNDGNIKKDGYVQFAEQYFSKLKLNNTTDAFGRPAREWVYDGAKVGTYVKSDLLVQTYTQEVTGRDLYDLLGKTAIENNDVYVYIDGVDDYARNSAIFTADNMIKSNTKGVGATGDGVVTEVYFDTENDEITIAIINTYLAKATDDYDEDKEELDIDVYSYDTTKTGTVGKNIKDTSKTGSLVIDGEEVNVADYKDGDFLLVTIADGEVQTAVAPEVLEGATLTAFSLTKKTITTGGTTYGEADSASYDPEVLTDYTGLENLKDKTYNVFMDGHGYYIGIELVEDDLQYVFVTGYEPYTKNLSTAKADVGAIFLDGKMDTISVKVKDNLGWNPNGDPVENSWYSYTVGSDNVYTLTPVYTAQDGDPFNDAGHTKDKAAQFAYAYTTAKDIDKANISLPVYSANRVGGTVNNVVYGNADSVYISVSTETLSTTSKNQATIIDNVESISTGIKNTNMTVTAVSGSWDDSNSSAGVYTLYNNKGYVIASIVVGEDAAATSNYAFITSKNASTETYTAEDDMHTWTREAIINGALTEIKEQGDTLEWIGSNGSELHMTQGNWYKISYNANGYVTKAELINGTESPKVVTKIDDIDPDETVLLMTNAASKLHIEGWTLFITQGNTDGFAVADDAKAVLIEMVDNDQFDTITYYDSKEDNVKDAIDDLNNNFQGSLYAIFEDGVATSVIIMDSKNQSTDIGGGQTDAKIHVTLGTPITVTWEDEEPTLKEVISAIQSEMESKGYRMGTPTQSGNTFTWEGTSPLGYPATFTWNCVTGISEVVSLKVNGSDVQVAASKTYTAESNCYMLVNGKEVAGSVVAGSLTSGDEVVTNAKKVTVTNAAGTAAAPVYVTPNADGDYEYTVPVEGNYYKVDAGSETAYDGNETVTLSNKDTAIQTGFIKVGSDYKKIGESVEVTTDSSSTNYKMTRGDEVSYAEYGTFEVTDGEDITIEKGYVAVKLGELKSGIASAQIDGDGFVKANGQVTVNVTVGVLNVGTNKYVKATGGSSDAWSDIVNGNGTGTQETTVQVTVGTSDATIALELSDTNS